MCFNIFQQRLTEQILVSNSPRLGCIKVGVPTDAVTGEVGVGQEAPLAVKRTAVTMETFSKEDHNVCKLLHLVPYVAVGDFPETEGGDALPHLEGLPDGLMGLVLTHLRGVVLNTEKWVCACVGVRGGRLGKR